MRKDFTILRSNDVAYFDQAAASLTPDQVLRDIQDYYCNYRSNVHRGIYEWSEKASKAYEDAREEIARFIGADKDEIIFTQGTTSAINLAIQIYFKYVLKEGQVILLSPLEHHANLVPWQRIAKECGAKVEYLKLDENFEIDWKDLESRLDQVSVIAVTHSSNVLGVKYDIGKIASYGVTVLVDGAQFVPHEKLDVKESGVGFYAFSAQKMYGPTGMGILYVNKQYHDQLKPHYTGGGMVQWVSYEEASFQSGPIQFEPGTPNVAGAIGFGSAIRYINKLGYENIQKHEREIMKYLLKRVEDLGLKTYGPFNTTILSFSYPGVHPHDVATLLAERGVMVRAGHHCCMPLMGYLGVNALTRISIGCHNTKEDVDKLVHALEGVKEVML